MKTTEADIRFPVLTFTKDDQVWRVASLDILTTSGPITLKENMQIGMEIIDVEGRRWRVRSVRKMGRVGAFLPWLLRSLAGTPQYRIEHDLESLQPVAPDQMRSRVCGSMKAHPLDWCDADDTGALFAALLEEVKATKTVADIHQLLGPDDFRSY